MENILLMIFGLLMMIIGYEYRVRDLKKQLRESEKQKLFFDAMASKAATEYTVLLIEFQDRTGVPWDASESFCSCTPTLKAAVVAIMPFARRSHDIAKAGRNAC